VAQAVCGNGVMDAGEQCETNQPCAGPNQTCDMTRCRCAGRVLFCGNAVLDPEEECDDGNTVSGDGCSAGCAIERSVFATSTPVCGNRLLETFEQCDDGNLVSGDGCSAACIIEPSVIGESTASASQEWSASSSFSSFMHEAAGSGGNVPSLIVAEQGDDGHSASSQQGGEPVYASLIPLPVIPFSGPVSATGPAAVAVIAAGAAGGFALLRRRKRSGK